MAFGGALADAARCWQATTQRRVCALQTKVFRWNRNGPGRAFCKQHGVQSRGARIGSEGQILLGRGWTRPQDVRKLSVTAFRQVANAGDASDLNDVSRARDLCWQAVASRGNQLRCGESCRVVLFDAAGGLGDAEGRLADVSLRGRQRCDWRGVARSRRCGAVDRFGGHVPWTLLVWIGPPSLTRGRGKPRNGPWRMPESNARCSNEFAR